MYLTTSQAWPASTPVEKRNQNNTKGRVRINSG